MHESQSVQQGRACVPYCYTQCLQYMQMRNNFKYFNKTFSFAFLLQSK